MGQRRQKNLLHCYLKDDPNTKLNQVQKTISWKQLDLVR